MGSDGYDWAFEDLGKITYDDFCRIDMLQSKARKYFPYCPLCGNGKEVLINVGMGGKDTISCEKCGAKWHIYFGMFGGELKWAKLESPSKDGRGREYLGNKIEAIKWKEMALRSHEVFKRNKELFG